MIVERQNIIDAPSERVWERIITSEGINDELRPWMTMSMSRGAESLTVDNIPVGTPIGRCWMRLFGVLPFRLRQLDDRRALAGSRLSRGVDDAVHAAMAPRAHPGPDSTAKPLCATASRLNSGGQCGCSRPSLRQASAHCSGTGSDDYSATSAEAESTFARRPSSRARRTASRLLPTSSLARIADT